jgi:hypothetical protein
MGARSKRGRMWAWVYLTVFEEEDEKEENDE